MEGDGDAYRKKFTQHKKKVTPDTEEMCKKVHAAV